MSMTAVLVYETKAKKRICLDLKKKVFTKLVEIKPDLFLNIRDKITDTFILSGTHDVDVTQTILFLAEKKGYNQVFLDIGANIGLISYKVANHFEKLYAYEPNPRLILVLKANLYDLLSKKLTVKPYALGKGTRKTDLTVPLLNYGGAFINNDFNSLTRKQLASKDSLRSIDSSTHFSISVNQIDALSEFRKIFNANKVSDKYIIKIDCEGMDQFLIEELLKALPRKVNCAIVFENHSRKKLNPNLTKLIVDMNLFEIQKAEPWEIHDVKLVKLLKAVWGKSRINLIKVDIREKLTVANYLLTTKEIKL